MVSLLQNRCHMNRLIVGCGYLGRRVAKMWLCLGQHVTALTRRPDSARQLQKAGLDAIIGDVLQPESLTSLPQADTVLHAVGLDRSSGASMRSVYVDGLANVLDRLPPPGKFIYISSSSVYGQTDGSWVDEDSPTAPQEEAGRIVLEAERLLQARLPEAIILRFGGIYGPGRLLRQRAIRAREPIVGDADKWLNLIHVADGARAVLAAEEHGQPGRICNVCDGQPVKRRDFYTELARCLGAPAPRFTAPPPDQPTPPHEKANRRIGNRRMLSELRVALTCPNHLEGLRRSVE